MVNMSSLRSRVLSCFKSLHRARLQVFEGDATALAAGRTKINEEFRKNLTVNDPKTIEELVTQGADVAKYLKSSVVQVRQKSEKESYELRLTKDTAMLNNAPYTGGDDDINSYKDITKPSKCS